MSNIGAMYIKPLLFPPKAQSPLQLHIELLPVREQVDRKLHSGDNLGVKKLRFCIHHFDHVDGIQSPRNNGTLNPVPEWWPPQNPIFIRKTIFNPLCSDRESL